MRTSLALLSLVMASTACAGVAGSGVIRAEPRTVAAFDEVQLSGGLTVVIHEGAPAVRVEADDNLLKFIRTEVVGSRLVVGTARNTNLSPTRDVKVDITLPRLKALEASGGVEVALQAPVDPHFALEASGGVKVKAPSLRAESLQVRASGGVELALGGQASQAAWETSGGVTVHARELLTETVAVDASGGCDLELTATKAITGEASGGVDLKVHGDPPRSRVHTSGGADLSYLKDDGAAAQKAP